MEKIKVKPAKIWVTNNLFDLPENYYDYVIINHVLYCFDDLKYRDYMWQVWRILKTGGTVIITAELLSALACLHGLLANNRVLRKIFRKNDPRVFWGYLRTLGRHRKMLSEMFDIIECGTLSYGGQKMNYSYYLCRKKNAGYMGAQR